MIAIIISCIGLMIILVSIYLLSKQLTYSKKNNTNNLQDVVNQLNNSNKLEYKFDKSVLENNLVDSENILNKNYETKKDLANQVTSESIISNQSKFNSINLNNTIITSQENDLTINNDTSMSINNTLKISKNKINSSGELNLAGYPVATQNWVNKNSTPRWENIQNKPDILNNNSTQDIVFNNIKFSKDYTGFSSINNSEITNDTTSNKQLIIVGNSSSGTRKVGIWDQLDVHGDLNVANNLSVNGGVLNKNSNNNLSIKSTTDNSGVVLGPWNGAGGLRASKDKIDTNGTLNISGKMNSSTNICINDVCISKSDITGISSIKNSLEALNQHTKKLQDAANIKQTNPTPINCVVSDWGVCDKQCGSGTQTRSIITQAQNGGSGCPTLSQQCNTQACVQAPSPINCVVSAWGACDKSCGTGTQTRSITQQAANGGSACPVLSQACNTQACPPAPTNCVVSAWGACDKACGGGTQTRTVTTPAANGGSACPALSQACNPQACPQPINCAVSAWGACDKACGGGTQTRSITTAAANGGSACPALSQACNSQACPQPINCAVSGWSACDKACGGGTQTRSITQQPQNGGTACPALSQACNSQACPQPINCAVSAWGACDKACGGGTQTRTVTQQPQNGGTACPALSQACNSQACPAPINCAVSGWGSCSKPCGSGTQSRSITQQPANGGTACPALSQTCNPQACPVDCSVSGWGACNKSCGSGVQYRSITQQPANGGAACPVTSQSCNQQACPVDCAVSGWGACSKTCGTGTQYRSITQQPQNGGAACPATSQTCNTQACPQPINCAVSGWGSCSKTCGTGTQTRSITQQSANGGATCPALSQTCNTQACPPSVAYIGSSLNSSGTFRLYKNQKLVSPNGQYTFVVQDDNNIVMYAPQGAKFATNTNGSAVRSIEMQGDGNLVVYTTSGQAVWASQSTGKQYSHNAGATYAPYTLKMQDDGNLVIYDRSNKVPWSLW